MTDIIPGVTRFQPKGSMCIACAKNKEDCSTLKFDTMPVIERHQEGQFNVVKCTEFVRGEV
jgi:hypothetical protein